MVVGADGHHSRVARSVKPQQYNEKPPLQVSYYTYMSGLPMDGRFEVYLRPGRGFAAWPTNDDLTVVIGGWPRSELATNRKDFEGSLLATFELVPDFAARFHAAEREARFVGMSEANFLRKPFGPGWALVGDAGYTKDFITGLGISDAFRDAGLCATALDQAFSGRRPFDDAMAAYQSERDRQALPFYEFTALLATLQPFPPELERVLNAVHGDQDAMDAFARVGGAVTSPAEFFCRAVAVAPGIVRAGVDRARSNGPGNPVRNPELARSGRDARDGHRHWAQGLGRRPSDRVRARRPVDSANRHCGLATRPPGRQEQETMSALDRLPEWATTGVGSLPHTDVEAAMAHVAAAYDLPFCPQLPRLDGDMITEWLGSDPSRCGWSRARDRERPRAWNAFLSELGHSPPPHGVVKLQVTGPATLAYALGDRSLAHEIAVWLAANVAEQVRALDGFDVLLMVDEPALHLFEHRRVGPAARGRAALGSASLRPGAVGRRRARGARRPVVRSVARSPRRGRARTSGRARRADRLGRRPAAPARARAARAPAALGTARRRRRGRC